MRSANKAAFLNLIYIIINFVWLVIVDNKKIFGTSLYETFYQNWSYLTPHYATFEIWKVIAICFVTTALFYCILLRRERDEDRALAEQISSSENWIIYNQLFLGLSIVLKVNNYLTVALLFTIATFYTLNKLNYIFKIRDYKNPTAIHIFTRTSMGLYSGWLVYLMGFNGLPVLSHLFKMRGDETIFFILALIFLLVSFSFILYKAIICILPALLVGYTAGVLGSYFYNIQSQNTDIYHQTMQYAFLSIMLISISMMIILLYRKRKALLALGHG